MLTRLYIDNFRTFINFEIAFGDRRLLMGPLGAGKTALVEVVDHLRQLIGECARIHHIYLLAEWSAGLAGAEGEMQFERDLDSPDSTGLPQGSCRVFLAGEPV